jgi:hypothetical protein
MQVQMQCHLLQMCHAALSVLSTPQIVDQHQACSTASDPAARLMGFATVEERRKQHARAHVLLANWLAESGQGYHGDILSMQINPAMFPATVHD